MNIFKKLLARFQQAAAPVVQQQEEPEKTLSYDFGVKVGEFLNKPIKDQKAHEMIVLSGEARTIILAGSFDLSQFQKGVTDTSAKPYDLEDEDFLNLLPAQMDLLRGRGLNVSFVNVGFAGRREPSHRPR